MGYLFLDQYTLLHFATGVIFYFFGFDFFVFLAIHTLFEIVENTKTGMFIINKYLTFWPGGKPGADSFINRYGDTLGAILGWYLAYLLDSYVKEFTNHSG